MGTQELNKGVVFTNDNCIGCNRCISGCVAMGANVVVRDPVSDHSSVLVDPNRCILCGSCVSACVHQARSYHDDTDEFFAALARGEEISILVSPTLMTDYEKQYHHILGYLRHLGVRHIYNTGFGGDLMVWVCMNFIHSFGLSGVISQFCPVIVNYLEKYKPELLPYLMPVQSPVICTAIYVNDYLKVTDKLAYISPCIAGKHEIEDVNTYGRVTYNVTFERLMKRLEGVNISPYYAEDERPYGLGALIPMSGGLSDNIERYIGFDKVLIQTEGPTNIFPYFDHYQKEVVGGSELPFLVEALSCTNGCNFGTGTNCGAELRNQMTFSAHRMKEMAYSSGTVATAKSSQERMVLLNKKFEEFELSSFVRQYDMTRQVIRQEVAAERIEQIFADMYKDTDRKQQINCGSCGYRTCMEMAQAIGDGINVKENCISYSKECIRQETEKINNLLAEISSMNEELKTSTQLKSNFLANMSHEIRTPMNAIIGMAEMALRGPLQSEERGYIQQIKASGRSLLAIINDILDFSKIESGKMELSESEYRVMSIINDTVNIVMTRIDEKEISLLVDIDPNLPRVLMGDDIRIKQVLVNLANNAVKFTEKGCVEIRMEQQRREKDILLSVSVRDTGMGIKPEDLDKLFNSFQQVDSKRNRNVEGTGLGLAISRQFVGLMNGTVDVKSTYGEGSTFSFCIPQRIVEDRPCVELRQQGIIKTASVIFNGYVRESFLRSVAALGRVENTECGDLRELQAAMDAGVSHIFINYPCWSSEMDTFARAHPEVQTTVIIDPRKELVASAHVRKLHQPAYALNIAAALNNEDYGLYDQDAEGKEFRFEAPEAQVLLVDDNAINLTVAKGLLGPLRMQITSASGAREAIALLEEQRFDIVFMDHMMPDIDGVEATHIIRAMEGDYYQKLPIIALTANAINNAKEMFLREGMSDFVAKPIEMVDITSKLKKWLPPEKVHELNATDSTATAAAQPELVIEGLDVRAGLALSGTMELYRTVLEDYCKVIEKKASLIERYAAAEEIPAYTIEVHALKSASRLIGATELGELAAMLEKCGHDGDRETIAARTGELLERYRAYLPILAPYCAHEAQQPRQTADLQRIAQLLEALCTALDDFDIDAAQAQVQGLSGYMLEGEAQGLLDCLTEAVESMEYDDALDVAHRWQALV